MQIDVHLDAIKHNLGVAKSLIGGASLMAVVKTDAYGHGVDAVVHALDEADMLAVATLEEGLSIRNLGIRKPVVILSRLTSPACLQRGLAADLEFVLHTEKHVDWYVDTTPVAGKPKSGLSGQIRPSVWLKYDAGMHRLGLDQKQYQHAHDRLRSRSAQEQIGVIAHFSDADTPSKVENTQQLSSFELATVDHTGVRSIANSAALIVRSESHFDWVRPGIMLYGSSPLRGQSAESLGLRPAMTLSAELIAVRSIKSGDAVGYSGRWVALEDTKIGVVGIGYGDGYPRSTRDGCSVQIDGNEYPLVGRVSMDTLCVDLGRSSGLSSGERVELWGPNVSIDRVAEYADTIPYELMTRMSARKPTRVCRQ